MQLNYSSFRKFEVRSFLFYKIKKNFFASNPPFFLTTFFLITFLLEGLIGFSQITVIPNPNFKQALIDLEIDTNGKNNNILNSDTVAATSLNLLNKEIASLYGVEVFTSLARLDYQRNDLRTLNVSANTYGFDYLVCGNNHPTAKNNIMTQTNVLSSQEQIKTIISC